MVQFKNCCFVQFLDLQTAMQAHQSAQGMNIRGFDLRVGWGRVSGSCVMLRVCGGVLGVFMCPMHSCGYFYFLFCSLLCDM